MSVTGDATSMGISLQLGTSVATFTLLGTAPINLLDALDSDAITGNEGNYVITVTGGADSVDGGAGTDRHVVDYRLTTGAITGTTASVADAGGLGTVTLTAGTFEHFTILTGSGADTITTGEGDDIIDTGNGASTVVAGGGANTITGGTGADTDTALDGGNIIDGGEGGRHLHIWRRKRCHHRRPPRVDTIVAGGGNDLITVRGGADASDSGTGSDRLIVELLSFKHRGDRRHHRWRFDFRYNGSIAYLGGNSSAWLQRRDRRLPAWSEIAGG